MVPSKLAFVRFAPLPVVAEFVSPRKTLLIRAGEFVGVCATRLDRIQMLLRCVAGEAHDAGFDEIAPLLDPQFIDEHAARTANEREQDACLLLGYLRTKLHLLFDESFLLHEFLFCRRHIDGEEGATSKLLQIELSGIDVVGELAYANVLPELDDFAFLKLHIDASGLLLFVVGQLCIDILRRFHQIPMVRRLVVVLIVDKRAVAEEIFILEDQHAGVADDEEAVVGVVFPATQQLLLAARQVFAFSVELESPDFAAYGRPFIPIIAKRKLVERHRKLDDPAIGALRTGVLPGGLPLFGANVIILTRFEIDENLKHLAAAVNCPNLEEALDAVVRPYRAESLHRPLAFPHPDLLQFRLLAHVCQVNFPVVEARIDHHLPAIRILCFDLNKRALRTLGGLPAGIVEFAINLRRRTDPAADKLLLPRDILPVELGPKLEGDLVVVGVRILGRRRLKQAKHQARQQDWKTCKHKREESLRDSDRKSL